MKLLINFLKIIGCYTFNTIDLIYPIRDVYISSQIQQEQIYYIEKSIEKMNLYRTYDKDRNHIRIQYDNDIIGNTAMSGSVYSFGSFVIENTTISFNPSLYDEVLSCVILHELGHSMGLMHNSNVGSIMNYTLYLDPDYYVMNANTECFLSRDDLDALEYLSKKNMISNI